jgi:nucleotidyltransferase/DNA polymerase involved in DNA repair
MYTFDKAILHFDGDSFFASVEQIMDYRLRGKAVVTGGERNAVTSVSVEGKRRGLGRGMSLKEIKIRCPDAIVVPSDYRSYSIFAQRMYKIVRTYANDVEEYSIDECFADITGLDEKFAISYEELSQRIKTELEDSLGITFGVGLGPTKTLAKIASKANKPAGLTIISDEATLKVFLENTPIQFVWGLGGASGLKLQKLGAETAYLFTQKEDWWLTSNSLGKPYRDIWLELKGKSVKKLEHGVLDNVHSLMRTRTFTPPSMDRGFVFSQLSQNVEDVCAKARRHKVRARGMSFYLKTQEFTYHAVSLELTIPITNPVEVLKHIEEHFDEVFAPGVLYRATGITLRGLLADRGAARDLFGQLEALEERSKYIHAFDAINTKYGKHTLALGSSLRAITHDEGKIRRRAPTGLSAREKITMPIEYKQKTLHLPYLGLAR